MGIGQSKSRGSGLSKDEIARSEELIDTTGLTDSTISAILKFKPEGFDLTKKHTSIPEEILPNSMWNPSESTFVQKKDQ